MVKNRIALSMRIGAGDVAGDSSAPKRERKPEQNRGNGNRDNGNRNRGKVANRNGNGGNKNRDNRNRNGNNGGNRGGNGFGTMADLFKDIKLN